MTTVNKIPIKHSIVFISTCGWAVLGFKRGLNSYDYNYLWHEKFYPYSKKKTSPFCIDKLGWGLAGTFVCIIQRSIQIRS